MPVLAATATIRRDIGSSPSFHARHACKSREIAALLPKLFTSMHRIPMTFARFHFYFYFSYPSPKAEEKR
jgi:hypothetical protein